jgi:predicted O-methyltransferase YrrM
MKVRDQTADQRKISKYDKAVATAWDTVRDALVDAAEVDLSWIQPPPRNDSWTVAPDALRLLVSLVTHARPRHILEFGSGLSTRVLAWACSESQPSCRITTIDHDPEYSQTAQEEFAACPLNCHVKFQIAPVVARTYRGKLLPTYHLRRRQFASQRPVDLVLIDGPVWPVGGREGTLYQILELSRPGTIVLLDDAGRKEETGVLADWQAVLGDAIETRLLPGFAKGLAAIIVREPHIPVKR